MHSKNEMRQSHVSKYNVMYRTEYGKIKQNNKKAQKKKCAESLILIKFAQER